MHVLLLYDCGGTFLLRVWMLQIFVRFEQKKSNVVDQGCRYCIVVLTCVYVFVRGALRTQALRRNPMENASWIVLTLLRYSKFGLNKYLIDEKHVVQERTQQWSLYFIPVIHYPMVRKHNRWGMAKMKYSWFVN